MKRTLFWSGLSFASEFLVGFISLSWISRMYSTEELGAWVLFITFLFLGTKMREGMVQNALVKFSQTDEAKFKEETFGRGFIFSLSLEILFSSIALLFGIFLPDGLLSSLLLFYGAMAIPQMLFRYSQLVLQSEVRTQEMAYANVTLILLMLSVIGLSLLFAISFQHLPFVLGIPFFISAIINYSLRISAKNWFSKRDSEFPIAAFLSYIKSGFIREGVGTLSSRAYLFMSAWMGGLQSSAFVGIASRYTNLIYLPNSAYQSVLYPKACQAYTKTDLRGIETFYRKSLAQEFLAFIPFSIALIVGSYFLIPIIHGEAYMASVPFLAVLVLHGAFISPIGHAFGSIMHVLEKPESVTVLVTYMSLLNLITTIGFSFIWGVWGSVLAPIFTDIIGLFVMHSFLKKAGINGLIGSYFSIKQEFNLLIAHA